VSIYYAKRIRETEQVERITEGVFAGEVACASTSRHYEKGSSRSYYSKEVPTPAAAGVFIEWHDSSKVKVDYVTFLCPEHGRSVKSAITKGNYAGRDAEFAPETPGVVALNVAGYIAAKERANEHLATARRIEAEARDLAYTRENWGSKRADYNSVAGLDKVKEQVTTPKPDQFGRVYVTIGGNKYSAAQALAVAEAMVEAAHRAADQTSVAVRP